MAGDDRIGTDVVYFFQRAMRYMSTVVEALDDEVLAWTPAPETTPISNIVLHALGSTVSSFTIVVGEPWERDRDAEFSAAPLPARELVERIGAAVRQLDEYRDRVTAGDLVAVRPRPARGETFTGLQVLLNSYGHLTAHISQIELTLQLAERRT